MTLRTITKTTKPVLTPSAVLPAGDLAPDGKPFRDLSEQQARLDALEARYQAALTRLEAPAAPAAAPMQPAALRSESHGEAKPGEADLVLGGILAKTWTSRKDSKLMVTVYGSKPFVGDDGRQHARGQGVTCALDDKERLAALSRMFAALAKG